MTGGSRLAGPVLEALVVGAYTVPTTDRPEQDATLTWSSTTVVVVEATHGEHRGVGWTYSAPAVADLVRQVLADSVVGTPVADVGRAAVRMAEACRNLGQGGLAAHARSAVDAALWDLKARVLGCSLADLLGGVRDVVPVYGSGGFTSLDDDRLVEQVQGWLASGMRQVKVKVGRDPELDRHRIELVRKVVGEDVALYADANGGWQRGEAAGWAARLGEVGVVWLEEPLTSEDLDGLRQLRGTLPPGMALAAGEYVDGLDAARRMLSAEAVDVLQLDATRCGGITGFLEAEAMARAHHLTVSAHCAPTLHLALGAAAPSLRHLEWFHDHARIEDLLFDGAPIITGGAAPVDRSVIGTGLTMRPDAERFRIDERGRSHEEEEEEEEA